MNRSANDQECCTMKFITFVYEIKPNNSIHNIITIFKKKM